jgi:conjugal transfer pilus assembly protein TraV
MTHHFPWRARKAHQLPLVIVAMTVSVLLLPGCTAIGSAMSPYSETFSCKNDDHGQCIHPDKAYADAVAGRPSRSDPAVTSDRKMLHGAGATGRAATRPRGRATPTGAFEGYRDSVYQELKGLVEAPVTPMLKPSRGVRTLILPYADRQRPNRLYMPRYVYSILDRPVWVVGGYLVEPVSPAARAPVLGQIRDKPADADGDAPVAGMAEVPVAGAAGSQGSHP